MRVSYLVNQYPKVSHTFIRREILALEALGWQVSRYALRGWDESTRDAVDAGELGATRYVLRGGMAPLAAAALHVLVRHPRRWWAALRLTLSLARVGRRSVLHHLVYLAEACWLLRDFGRTGAPSHLHVHFGTNGAQVAWLCKTLGGPDFSITVHGPEEFDHVGSLSLPGLAQAADFLVAISSYGRSQLLRWLPQDQWPKVHVVPCGLDRSWLNSAPPDLPDAPTLVCVGRLCEQKAQLLLVEAAAVMAKSGRHFKIVLAGDGEHRDAITALIRAHGIERYVTVTGWLNGDEVRQELAQSRALVLSSFAEGLPVVLMEAMAMGRPVLSTWIAGIPELVRPGVDGWLIPPGDVSALVDAMGQVLDTPAEELCRMGASARARVTERHDIERSAAALSTILLARTSCDRD